MPFCETMLSPFAMTHWKLQWVISTVIVSTCHCWLLSACRHRFEPRQWLSWVPVVHSHACYVVFRRGLVWYHRIEEGRNLKRCLFLDSWLFNTGNHHVWCCVHLGVISLELVVKWLLGIWRKKVFMGLRNTWDSWDSFHALIRRMGLWFEQQSCKAVEHA